MAIPVPALTRFGRLFPLVSVEQFFIASGWRKGVFPPVRHPLDTPYLRLLPGGRGPVDFIYDHDYAQPRFQGFAQCRILTFPNIKAGKPLQTANPLLEAGLSLPSAFMIWWSLE